MYETTKDILIPVVSILISAAVAYITAIYAIRREISRGRFQMLELVRRYFLNVIHAFDEGTKLIKKDAKSKKMYVEELKAVLEELQELVVNPYFTGLIERYPRLSMLLLQTRRELVEHDEVQVPFAVNKGTIRQVWGIYLIIRKELPQITNSDLDKHIVEQMKGLNLSDIE